MRHRYFITILTALLCTFGAAAQETPKTGWSFTPFPDISYNSDIGLNLGGFCDFFYYGDGSDYPNFQHHIATAAAWATKGSWYVHVLGESKTLIPGLRVNGSLTFRQATMQNFYGFNGPWAPFDADLELNADSRTAWYTLNRQTFRAAVGARGRIAEGLDWFGGALYRNIRVRDFSLKNYDSGRSLYNEYVAAGLIRPDEAAGGDNLELRAGAVYDSRDIEWVPNKGLYGELCLNGNVDLSHGKYHYLQLAAHFRHFVPIIFSRLTLAYHIGLQHQIAGEMPFYNLHEISTLHYQYEEFEGLGSRYTLRGYRLDRMLAAGYGWANVELRARVLSFDLLKQHFDIVVNPFFDAGTITRTYRLDEQKALPTLWRDASKEAVFLSAGAGVKLHMNTNFILSIELAKGFNPQLGDLTVSMATTYMF